MLARLSRLAQNSSTLKYIIALFAICVFVTVAIIVYKRKIAPALNPSYVPNKEFASGRVDEGPALYFFYTTWCPHCKTAKPVWDKFEAQMKGKKVNGQEVEFIKVDCDKEKALADRYEVKGYPTIKLVSGNQVVEYDAKPEISSLEKFLKSSV